MSKRARYGVNRDMWTVLESILLSESHPQDFNSDTDTLRGRAVNCDRRNVYRGQLPYPSVYAADLNVGEPGETLDYVIFSYHTPIAWRDTSESGVSHWVIPPVKYSVTTSKQQGRVKTALHTATKREWSNA